MSVDSQLVIFDFDWYDSELMCIEIAYVYVSDTKVYGRPGHRQVDL